jgi:poly(3-hydroxyalkanoate) depolymerase
MPKTETRTIDVDGQLLKVGIRRGGGVPLLIFNGIGANMELLEPLTRALHGIETIVFDLPGIGGSAVRKSPYRLRGLARLAKRLLEKLGYGAHVDVLGVSWGGALAQQFAHSYPQRCRRLVLAATTPGVLMVPGSPFLLAKLFAPRRYKDPTYLHKIAPDLYGGEVRRDPKAIEAYASNLRRPHWLGYLHQQMAFCGWTSLFWLPRLRQPTLVLGGRDDPLVPLVNSRILAWLIPRAKLQIVNDGHLFLMTGSQAATPLIRKFLLAPSHSG